MASSVAGQDPISEGAAQNSTFFPKKPIVRLFGNTLRIDKEELASRAESAPGVSSDDEGFVTRLLAKIRAFFARLLRVILPAKFFAPVGESGQPRAVSTAGQLRGDGDSNLSDPILSESDTEIVAEGLPEWTLERARQTVQEYLDGMLGGTLPDSLRAALTMPEIEGRQVFRALLQQNLDDTNEGRALRDQIQERVELMVGPYADAHGIDRLSAIRVFRADLAQGGVISARLDRNGEIRGHVSELERLDSKLAGLAMSRDTICTRALQAGAYTREELSSLVMQYGLDSAFLAKSEVAASTAPEAHPGARPFSEGNVISMAGFRQKSGVSAIPAEPVPSDYIPAAHQAVEKAIATLVEQGVLSAGSEHGNNAAEALAQAAAVDAVLSDESEFESEFETEYQGDDLSSFRKKERSTTPFLKP